eukprot:gene7654-7857_t
MIPLQCAPWGGKAGGAGSAHWEPMESLMLASGGPVPRLASGWNARTYLEVPILQMDGPAYVPLGHPTQSNQDVKMWMPVSFSLALGKAALKRTAQDCSLQQCGRHRKLPGPARTFGHHSRSYVHLQTSMLVRRSRATYEEGLSFAKILLMGLFQQQAVTAPVPLYSNSTVKATAAKAAKGRCTGVYNTVAFHGGVLVTWCDKLNDR